MKQFCKGKHKYIFYIYPHDDKKGSFMFTTHSMDLKKWCYERGYTFDFQKLY